MIHKPPCLAQNAVCTAWAVLNGRGEQNFLIGRIARQCLVYVAVLKFRLSRSGILSLQMLLLRLDHLLPQGTAGGLLELRVKFCGTNGMCATAQGFIQLGMRVFQEGQEAVGRTFAALVVELEQAVGLTAAGVRRDSSRIAAGLMAHGQETNAAIAPGCSRRRARPPVPLQESVRIVQPASRQ